MGRKLCYKEHEKEELTNEVSNLSDVIDQKKKELEVLSEKVSVELKVPVKKEKKKVEVPSGERNLLGIEKKKTVLNPTGNVILSVQDFKAMKTRGVEGAILKEKVDQILKTDYAEENRELKSRNGHLRKKTIS